jgi:outer membrane protein TolC
MRFPIVYASILFIFFPGVLQGQQTLSWQQCVQRAVEYNAAVDIAQWDVRTAEVESQLQMGEFFPRFSLSTSTSRYLQGPREVFLGGEPFIQSGSAYNSYSMGANFSYLLFDWGNRLRERSALSHGIEAVESTVRDRKRQTMIEAFTLYCQVAEMEDLRTLYRQEYTSLQKQDTLISNLVDSGYRPAVDAARIQVQLGNFRSQVITHREQARNHRRELALFMGQPQDTSFVLQPLPETPEEAAGRRSLPQTETVLAAHPALQSIRTQIAVSETREQIRYWQMFPSVQFSSYYSRGDRQLEEVYGNWRRNWYTGLSLNLSLPLFQNSDRRLQLEQQKIRTKRLQAQLQQQRETLARELNQFRTQFVVAGEQFAIAQSNVEALQKIYTFEQSRYESGAGHYQEVLDALRSLLSGRQRVITAKYDLMRAQFTLEVLAGRWDAF